MQNNNYLAHHGIKGQKWGVRRFQNEDGSLTQAGRDRYGVGKLRSAGESIINRHGSKKASGFIEDNPEVAAVGMELASTLLLALGAIGIAKIAQHAAKNKDEKELKNDFYEKRTVKNLSDLKKSNKQSTPEENTKKTNPDYPKPGYNQNCVFCTTAMVMREKGYSVKARPSDNGHYTDRAFKTMFQNAKEIKSNKKKIESSLLALGDGAYGNVSVSWNLGGGHSIFWKNENGKIVYYDGQVGKKYDSKKLFNSIANDIEYTQLNNCEPTQYVLSAIDND